MSRVYASMMHVKDGIVGRILLDKTSGHETALGAKTPAALMAAWDADLRKIMEEFTSEYLEKHPK